MNIVIVGLTDADLDSWKERVEFPTLAALSQESLGGELRGQAYLNSTEFWTRLLSGTNRDGIPESERPDSRMLRLWDLLHGGEEATAILIDLPIRDVGFSLEGNPEGSHVIEYHSDHATLDPIKSYHARFQKLRDSMNDARRQFLLIVDDRVADGSDQLSRIDSEISETIQHLSEHDGETLFLIVSRFDRKFRASEPCSEVTPIGSFLLLSSLGTVQGKSREARIEDLAPTLLSLAGRQVPMTMSGRPIVWDLPRTIDEDRAVQERLKGLGYLS